MTRLPRFQRRARSAAAFAFAALTVAACGSSSGSGAASQAAASTAHVTSTPAAAGTTSTSAASTGGTGTNAATTSSVNAPKAIISLSPTATETLFAIGAGAQVVAVDDQSNYPATAPKTDLSGYTPNVEAIAARKPDLVVIADDGAKLVDALGKLGIKTVLQAPAKSFDDAYAQTAELGTLTGHAAEATALVGSIKSDLAALTAKAPKTPVRFYHELDDTLYSVSSSSFVGQVYALFGLQNIADAADGDKTGYPQLSPEYVVQANPQIIFLADTAFGQSADTVKARAGWSGIDAIAHGKVVSVDADISSRWGPRVVDFARTIAATLGG